MNIFALNFYHGCVSDQGIDFENDPNYNPNPVSGWQSVSGIRITIRIRIAIRIQDPDYDPDLTHFNETLARDVSRASNN